MYYNIYNRKVLVLKSVKHLI